MWSDHAHMEVMLSLTDAGAPSKTWRLNSELLMIDQIQESVRKSLEEYFRFNSDCGVSKGMTWDAMKAVIRGRFLAISSAYKKKNEVDRRSDAEYCEVRIKT